MTPEEQAGKVVKEWRFMYDADDPQADGGLENRIAAAIRATVHNKDVVLEAYRMEVEQLRREREFLRELLRGELSLVDADIDEMLRKHKA